MKICFFCQEDIINPPGGAATYVRSLSFALADRGHEVHVIMSKRRKNIGTYFEQVNGVFLHRLYTPGPALLYSYLYFIKAGEKFRELSKDKPFDVIHGNLPLLASWGVRGKQIPPVIEMVHCTIHQEVRFSSMVPTNRLNLSEALTRILAPELYRREKWLMKRAKLLITPSVGLREEVVAQYKCPVDKINVIPYGIEVEKIATARTLDKMTIRNKLGFSPDAWIILYLGRMIERKRVFDLIHALPKIKQAIPSALLVIVGKRTAYTDKIEILTSSYGLQESVIICDHAPYNQVPLYLRMANVYTLPSSYEGFPFTILESMSAGTPVIASRIPGIDEQIRPEETGLLHEVGNYEDIAAKAIYLYQNKALSDHISRNAYEFVRMLCDWKIIAQKTEELYNRVIK